MRFGHKFIKSKILSPVSIRIYIAFFSFISGVVLNRSIGIELKGQYTTILSYSNYAQMFLNMGICYSYSRFINSHGKKEAKEKIITIIWMQTIAFLLFSIMLAILGVKSNVIYIALLTMAVICNGQISFIAIIDNLLKRNIIILFFSIFNLMMNTVAYVLARGNLGIIIWFLLLRYLLETIALAGYNHYFIFKPKALDRETVKCILKIGIPTALMNLLIACNYNMDVIMLNVMKSGDTQVGIYGVAYSLSNMLWIIPDAFKEMVYEKTAQKEDNMYIVKCIFSNVLICLVVCFGFAFLGKTFLRIVYGEEFTVAFNVTLTLFFGILPMIAFKLIHPLYVNKGRANIVIILLLIAVTTNVVASYLLIPYYGAFGAALASVISYAVCGVLFFLVFYHEYLAKRNKQGTNSV